MLRGGQSGGDISQNYLRQTFASAVLLVLVLLEQVTKERGGGKAEGTGISHLS